MDVNYFVSCVLRHHLHVTNQEPRTRSLRTYVAHIFREGKDKFDSRHTLTQSLDCFQSAGVGVCIKWLQEGYKAQREAFGVLLKRYDFISTRPKRGRRKRMARRFCQNEEVVRQSGSLSYVPPCLSVCLFRCLSLCLAVCMCARVRVCTRACVCRVWASMRA